MIGRVLIVAGSDSGGGAGIQADMRAVTMLGGHPMTAVTAITAQNTLGVQAVHAMPPEMVVAQMRSVIDDLGVDAVKIGMIGSAETAHAVAEVLEALSPFPSGVSGRPCPRHGLNDAGHRLPEIGWGVGESSRDLQPAFPPPTPPLKGRGFIPIVFDPVMIATSGSVLADDATIAAFDRLLRVATLVTPNLPELAALGGEAAVLARGPALLVKGGHAEGATVTDRLVAADGGTVWTHPRIDTRHSHGTGCTLASGIATGLAQGMTLAGACDRAIAYVQAALAAAPGIGGGHGPMGHALGRTPFYDLLAAADPTGFDAAAVAAKWS